MAEFSYARSRETADRLIRRFGRSAELYEDAPAPSVDHPWDRSGGEAVPRSRQLVGSTLAVRTEYSRRDVNGTTILSSDSRIYLSAAAGLAVPAIGMSLVMGSDSYEVVNVRPLAPSGEVVMYEVQGRS